MGSKLLKCNETMQQGHYGEGQIQIQSVRQFALAYQYSSISRQKIGDFPVQNQVDVRTIDQNEKLFRVYQSFQKEVLALKQNEEVDTKSLNILLAKVLFSYEHRIKAQIYIDRLPSRIHMLEIERSMESYRRLILNSKRVANEYVMHMDEFIMDSFNLSAKEYDFIVNPREKKDQLALKGVLKEELRKIKQQYCQKELELLREDTIHDVKLYVDLLRRDYYESQNESYASRLNTQERSPSGFMFNKDELFQTFDENPRSKRQRNGSQTTKVLLSYMIEDDDKQVIESTIKDKVYLKFGLNEFELDIILEQLAEKEQ